MLQKIILTVLFTFSMSCFTLSSAFSQANEEFDKTQDMSIKVEDEIDLTKNYFEYQAKAGFIFTTGNTESLSFNIDTYLIYRIKRFENYLRFGAYFSHVSDTTTTNITGTITNFIFGVYRLDYYFNPRTTLYFGGGGYTDEIKGIDTAAEAFLGVSYYLLKHKEYSLRLSAGYNFTYEDRVSPFANEDIHSATASLLYKHTFNSVLALKNELTLEQNVAEISDFRLTNELDLQVKLNKTFSLIFGVDVRFDNEPVTGFEKLDLINDISLAVSF